MVFWLAVGALSLLVVAAFWVGLEWMRGWYPLDTPQDLGAAAGTMGALFSALAFVGIVATIVLQGHELALQRQELADTREVLKGQQEQLRAQSDVMARDSFERSLFGLLEVKRALLRDLNLGHVASTLRSYLKQMHRARLSPEDIETSVSQEFRATCYSSEHHYGPYLRVTYHTLEFIHRANLPPDDKRNYARLYRAQFSPDEMLVLLFNCSVKQWEDFRSLAEHYELFRGTMWPDEALPILGALLRPDEKSAT